DFERVPAERKEGARVERRRPDGDAGQRRWRLAERRDGQGAQADVAKLRMLAKTAKFPVVLSAVLGATSPNEALKVVEAAREFGFRPRVLVLHDGTGQMHLDEAGQEAFARVKEMLGG